MSTPTIHTSYREALDALLREQARPAEKYGHQPRLYALTRLVGEGIAYDDDIVYAAAYLHDLGVFVGHRPEEPMLLARWDHVQYAVEAAPELLRTVHFPEEKIAAVLEVIRTHQPRDTPQSPEATVLRDADILEQLGAIGILRAAAKVGRDTRYATFTSVAAFLERNLKELPDAMVLPATKRLAAPKIALLRAFLAGIEAEAHGCLF